MRVHFYLLIFVYGLCFDIEIISHEATFCAALAAAGRDDYYADDDTPACSTLGADGYVFIFISCLCLI